MSVSAVLIGLGLGVLAVIVRPWWAFVRYGDGDALTGADIVGMIVGPWLVAIGLVLLVVQAWSG